MRRDGSLKLPHDLGFLLVHLAPVAAIWTGARPLDWMVCGALYLGRMFFVTASYHRYFSHKTFRTSRAFQFVLAAVFSVGMLAHEGPALVRLQAACGTALIGFFLSTVLLYHGTYSINSLMHVVGTQRYVTGDESRNSPVLALITLGEGWHNNHHFYQASARQGFYWWEFDPTYYGLKVFSWVGLVWDLRPVPHHVRGVRTRGEARAARRALDMAARGTVTEVRDSSTREAGRSDLTGDAGAVRGGRDGPGRKHESGVEGTWPPTPAFSPEGRD